ncbi:SLC13 family permease [Pseudonocardia sp. HH130630-07]|uniref:SLC13 family permease n=1 Tax=Pseudonocardia sp. HH130630-07 TaxID=1690815 RepID=UPI000814D24A|nr:SLC13 family permease [Pseudonocardia sp. HH130630-07]ANY09435.1 hypothetical protein AFB00_27930 [Pseudonocardia sp. HH130630-07]
MNPDLIALLVLIAIFVIAMIRPVNVGAVAFVATFLVGLAFVGDSTSELLGGFPGDLFIILVGVTYLFAIARRNGTIDLLVHGAVRMIGGRLALMPWVMFLCTALVTSVGAVSAAGVAIIAPIGLSFAARHRISTLLVGIMVVQGACAGSFSPIGVFGVITNGVADRNGLPTDPFVLYAATFAFNVVLAAVAFLLFGGRELMRRPRVRDGGPTGGDVTSGTSGTHPAPGPVATIEAAPATRRMTTEQWVTVTGLVGLVLGTVLLDLDVGFVAVTIAVGLTLAFPRTSGSAVNDISWGAVLLICGVITYISLLEDMGTIDNLGAAVAGIGAAIVAALVVCYIGALVSAFASTVGILGALIPLAVPILVGGEVSVIGLLVALSISASVVDSSPISTNGALIVANSQESEQKAVFRNLMIWGMSLVAVIPIVTWSVFVLPF